MISETTLPLSPRTVSLPDGRYAFHDVVTHDVMATDSPPPEPVSLRCSIPMYLGTAPYRVTLTEYGDDSDRLIVFDFEESMDELLDEYRGAVACLRDNGRPILAGRVIEILQDAEEDPDVQVSLISLRDLARILTEHGDFSDPAIGPDSRGLIHGQWWIVGNGLLVVSFLGYGAIILTAQADDGPYGEPLDISERGPAPEVLGRYGHLVPRR